jgi:hypothetical protein
MDSEAGSGERRALARALKQCSNIGGKRPSHKAFSERALERLRQQSRITHILTIALPFMIAGSSCVANINLPRMFCR